MPEDTSDDSAYSQEPTLTETDIGSPSYATILAWMQEVPDARELCFDFWARGNYTRRLICHRANGIVPLQVCVSDVDQMRWAYRRLALAGLPVEFVYSGLDCGGGRCVGVIRLPKGFIFDAGWGYNCTTWQDDRKRYNIAMFGNARLLPSTVMDWIVDEVPDEFTAGRVFVAPARAIGVTVPTASESLLALSQVSGGTAIVPDLQVATSVMSLEIPFLDGMTPGQFRTFLNEHEGELTSFRRAFRNLVVAREVPEAHANNAHETIKELQFQIAELTRSEKYTKLRSAVAKLGGMLATLSAGIAVAAKPGTAISMTALAGAGAAGAALLGLWKQSIDAEERMGQNPYFVLWKLGVDRPSHVRSTHRVKAPDVPNNPIAKAPLIENANHWLCPPTCGVWFAGVRTKG